MGWKANDNLDGVSAATGYQGGEELSRTLKIR